MLRRFSVCNRAVFFIHEVRHAVRFVSDAARNVGCQNDIFQLVDGIAFLGRFFRVGNVKDRHTLGMRAHFVDQSGGIHLCASAGVDEYGVFAHARKELAADNADGLGLVGEVVGNNVSGFKDFFKRSLFYAERFGSFIGEEGVEDVKIQIEGTEKLDDLCTDHARAEKTDLRAVVAGEAVFGILIGPLASAADAAVEKALVGKKDFGNGDLRNGNTVCSPCGVNGNAEFKERTGESLYRACGVKYGFEIREVFEDLFLRQGEHTPCGKDVVNGLQFFFSCFQLVEGFEGIKKIQFAF